MFKLILLLIFLSGCSYSIDQDCKIIAHRGYWDIDGACDNSIRSLKNALDLNIYGTEFDVSVTKDDSLIVLHGPKYGGMLIENSTYKDLVRIRLSNGEKIPTLYNYLTVATRHPKTKLLIELKSTRLVKEIVNLIECFKVSQQVEYISFNLQVCKEIILINSHSRVLYLGSDIAPSDLEEFGLYGINYDINVLKQHPNWVKQAKEKGLKVYTWVVKYESEMIWCMIHNIDCATTDAPILFMSFLSEYQ